MSKIVEINAKNDNKELIEAKKDLNVVYKSSSVISAINSSSILNESMLHVVDNYIEYYASGKGHTARAKKYDLQHFISFLSKKNKSDSDLLVKDWTLQNTKDFIDHLLDKGEAPSTVGRRLATLKHLGRTLADRVPGFINPAREVKAPVYETSKPQGLTSVETRFLRDAAEQLLTESEMAFHHYRNIVLLEVLIGTGLRADEIRNLKRSQFTDDLSWIKNVKTKGKRFRDIFVHKELSDLLVDYFDVSKSEIVTTFPGSLSWNKKDWSLVPVFISTHKASILNPESFTLDPKTLWRIISSLGKKASLLSDTPLPQLHPHKLRHTFAHGLLETSNDIRLVAQALGHSDVRTTMRYTERSKEELAKAIQIQADKNK